MIYTGATTWLRHLGVIITRKIPAPSCGYVNRIVYILFFFPGHATAIALFNYTYGCIFKKTAGRMSKSLCKLRACIALYNPCGVTWALLKS